MKSEYFEARVQKVSVEKKEILAIKRYGFLNLRKKITKSYEDKCFIFVKIEGTDFTLKIKTTEDIIHQARVNELVSVHLKFEFEFACYHFLKLEKEKEEKIIEVEKKKEW